ncbi:MAG: hypothetical protein R3D57_18115 [Hyphomicrobiaceae bacterium]
MNPPLTPETEAERADALKRDGLLIGTAALSLLNGMHFSPFFDYGYILLKPIATGLLITSPLLSFYLTSLLLAASTLALAGVPAALFERWSGRRSTDATSLMVWLVAAAVLSFPSLLGAVGFWSR